ncbi:MAG: hypothetical protein HXX10_17110 [Rhodoplanes sp.]|uniref:hypothetical protein n=1 Tax=Rhodoplanes sp. TaxID=1968906 RepID=UPI0018014070|nr:hypothetical protein [Rhodoplanes sp.]NVO15755.1 hypothetical protein [Rhodoplanes sp.]
MTYWISAFATALLVIIGYATGALGALIALIAFAIALFLLWARQVGLMGAWTTFSLDRSMGLFLDGEDRSRLALIVSDREKLGKACTVAIALTALLLVFPTHQVGIAIAAAAVWSVFRIRRARRPLFAFSRPLFGLFPKEISELPTASPDPPIARAAAGQDVLGAAAPPVAPAASSVSTQPAIPAAPPVPAQPAASAAPPAPAIPAAPSAPAEPAVFSAPPAPAQPTIPSAPPAPAQPTVRATPSAPAPSSQTAAEPKVSTKTGAPNYKAKTKGGRRRGRLR